MVRWCSGYHARLSRERSRVQVPYEPPCGFIAQLAEHKTENLGVVGSIPTEATILNNDDFIFNVPIGIIYDMPILVGIGPKIPFKVNILGNSDNTVYTRVKEYGINNSMIE